MWLRALLNRRHVESEMQREIAAHLAMEQGALERSGLSPAEARRQAMIAFGGVERHKEAVRDELGTRLLGDLSIDLRYALRRFHNQPAFSIAVVGVLALGIGATTAMFSAVDAAMLRPLPFPRPQELVALRSIHFPRDLRFALGPPRPSTPRPHDPRFQEVAAMPETFSHVAGYAAGGLNVGDPSHPVRVRVGVVTSDFFATMGISPIRGRAFVAEEGAPGGPLSTVISYGFWQSQYDGREVVGQPIVLGEKSYVVVGIAPKKFGFPQRSDLWVPLVVPLDPNNQEALGRTSPSEIVARLAPGVSVATAGQRLLLRWEQDAVEGLPPGQKPDAADNVADVRLHGTMTPLRENLVGDHGQALLLLLGATGLLLLIACANVSHLLLSQATARRREVAVREVLGATRARVIRQLLVECTLLSLCGALLGMGLAWAIAGLLTRLLPQEVAGIAPIHIDLRVMGFAVALALFSGIGLGLWPAFGVTRTAPVETIKAGGTRGTGSAARRARRVLVAAELALTITLLICGTLLLRSFQDVMASDAGIQPDQVATLEMAFPLATLKPFDSSVKSFGQLHDIWGLERQRRRVDDMVEQLEHVPGITAAASVDNLPFNGNKGLGLDGAITVAGAPPWANGERRGARIAAISADYFRVMGIPLLRGRMFGPGDDSLAPQVAIVNRTFAERYWPGRDPLSGHFGFSDNDSIRITVVGVVADVRDKGLDQEPVPQAYFPAHQANPYAIVALVARGSLGAGAMLSAMQQSVHAVNPSQAVYNVQMMNDVIDLSVAPRRTNATLLMLFALLAVVLALLGVYSVVAYGVSQRHRELGIRAALGATGHDLLGLVAGEMAWSACVGACVGIAGAWLVSRAITSFLFGISAHDPATFVAVPVALLLTAAAATVIPALWVLRVNPAEVMRAD